MTSRIHGCSRRIACATSIASLLLIAGNAPAGTSVSSTFLTVNASNGSGAGTYSIPLSSPDIFVDNQPDGDIWYWNLPSQVSIMDGPNVVATLVSMTVLAGRNTQPDGEVRWGIDIDYGVVAGSTATSFELISPTVFFDMLIGARGNTSATRIGTDQNSNGISHIPGLLSGFGYEGTVNGGTLFRNYFNTIVTDVGSGSFGQAGNMSPPGTWLNIGPAVSSMQAKFMFTVSAGDATGGTSQYSIAPAPGAVALLGLAGLVGTRRRRA